MEAFDGQLTVNKASHETEPTSLPLPMTERFIPCRSSFVTDTMDVRSEATAQYTQR
jgi:hypothetical protein